VLYRYDLPFKRSLAFTSRLTPALNYHGLPTAGFWWK